MKESQKTKLCKHCKTEIPAEAKVCPNCKKKQGGVVKWIIIGVVIIAIIGSVAGNSDSKNPSDTQTISKSESSAPPNNTEKETAVDASSEITPESSSSAKPEDNIPTEYASALKSAYTYSKMMHMSKAGIYDQLTSVYGDKFSAEAAQYAIDNIEADWNQNALSKAKDYSETMYMSKQGIYDQLISEYGEKFTPEEAQYAIDNVKADWNKNALQKAKDYQKNMDMSPAAIRDQLTSEYGEKFTAEEADYAIEHLK